MDGWTSSFLNNVRFPSFFTNRILLLLWVAMYPAKILHLTASLADKGDKWNIKCLLVVGGGASKIFEWLRQLTLDETNNM